MSKARPGFTVGSLRGAPQAARPVARPTYGPVVAPIASRPRKCCGSGCADCPVGRRIRAARLGLPQAE